VNKQSLSFFTAFSFLYIVIGLFLLDGGLVLISVILSSSYVFVSNVIAMLNKKLSDFWVGFLISLICLFVSPLMLVFLLRYYSFCR
jgi:hypothetical protein